MKITLNAIKFINRKYGNGDDPAAEGVDALVTKIGAQLGAVEEVIDLGAKYQGIVVARVVACEKHSNADKLHVCKIDDGGVAQNVDRDKNGRVQVVCGAPNVREGLLVAWLPPGTTVPSTADKDPFVLEAREIRGQLSHGMLASPQELAISDNHDGILEIDKDVEPGTSFAEAYALNDTVIDIENKMFTHRPDCFGLLGVARELAGIRQKAYRSPDWYINPLPVEPDGEILPLEVRNEVPELVPRFMAVALRDVHVGPSPVWLQIFLSKVGLKPINNIVDYTNFFMLKTGQPLHAYDYDKVKARSTGDKAVLVAREASNNEKIALLNGKTVAFEAPAVVIATDQTAIGLGGIMGGADTEVDATSKNIILECATFDMYNIRRTAMRYGTFTDAATRYTKGQSPLQNDRVLAKIVDELRASAGAMIASKLFDVHGELTQPQPVTVSTQFINERLGLTLTPSEIQTLLQNVEFDVQATKDSAGSLRFTPPFWRTDIAIPEDIVEEVGRLYGFDHLPHELPRKDLTPAQTDAMLAFKQQVREVLQSAGANEILTYSFVHGKLFEAVGQKPRQAFHIRNALSPDLQYYRQSLLPSLLEKVHANIRNDIPRRTDDNEFAIYEINKIHIKGVRDQKEPEIPYEFMKLALVFASDDKTATRKYHGAPYYQARAYLDYLLDRLGVSAVYEALDPNTYEAETKPAIAPYAAGRAALIKKDGLVIGEIGEFHHKAQKTLKLPAYAAGFELDMNALLKSTRGYDYTPLSKFPKSQQDICFKVVADTPFAALSEQVASTLTDMTQDRGYNFWFTPIDIYQNPKDSKHKQITFRIWLSHEDKTLTTAEVNAALERVAAAAAERFRAVRV